MSEEEKKAIEEINKYTMYPEQREYLDIILNLIKRQEKEIKNLKEIEEEHKKINGDLRKEIENSISKSKIEEKIKELEEELKEKEENGLDFTIIHEHEIDTLGIIRTLKKLLESEE